MGGSHPIRQGKMVIGRDAGVDIALPWEATVSRRHAEIELIGAKCRITDLGSSNGTFLNGTAIKTPAEIKAGDELRLGQCVITVRASKVATLTSTTV